MPDSWEDSPTDEESIGIKLWDGQEPSSVMSLLSSDLAGTVLRRFLVLWRESISEQISTMLSVVESTVGDDIFSLLYLITLFSILAVSITWKKQEIFLKHPVFHANCVILGHWVKDTRSATVSRGSIWTRSRDFDNWHFDKTTILSPEF